ncbi:ATP-dependent DNA helicase PIF1-like protein, partial [Tanacetum coccineum]
MSRIPNHKLALKVGAPVMCLRNIDQRGGLCNETRLQIPRMGINNIEAKIISGGNVGDAKTVDGACYLELKVPSRSRRVGCWDFLDRYGHHYGDGISRPLLPSELTENMRLRVGCNPRDADSIKEFAESILSIGNGKIGGKNDGHAEVEFLEDMLIPDSDDH